MLEGRETAGTLRRHVRTWKLALRVPAQGTVAWEPVEWTGSVEFGDTILKMPAPAPLDRAALRGHHLCLPCHSGLPPVS